MEYYNQDYIRVPQFEHLVDCELFGRKHFGQTLTRRSKSGDTLKLVPEKDVLIQLSCEIHLDAVEGFTTAFLRESNFI